MNELKSGYGLEGDAQIKPLQDCIYKAIDAGLDPELLKIIMDALIVSAYCKGREQNGL